jgi:hypothetical protein
MSLWNRVGETNTASFHLHQHFASIWHGQIDFFNGEQAASLFEGGPFVVRRQTHCDEIAGLLLEWSRVNSGGKGKRCQDGWLKKSESNEEKEKWQGALYTSLFG